ncbi:MAG: asparagine synthase-related protein, partial [Candidatus Fermentibacter daniensis]
YSLWLEGELRETAESYFSKQRVEATGFLSYPAVRNLFDQHLSRRRDNGRVLWCILNVLLWHDLFIAGQGFRRHLA